MLGGDHTITLAALRSTIDHWGVVNVIHFDSHIDTWDPSQIGGGISEYASVNHVSNKYQLPITEVVILFSNLLGSSRWAFARLSLWYIRPFGKDYRPLTNDLGNISSHCP